MYGVCMYVCTSTSFLLLDHGIIQYVFYPYCEYIFPPIDLMISSYREHWSRCCYIELPDYLSQNCIGVTVKSLTCFQYSYKVY